MSDNSFLRLAEDAAEEGAPASALGGARRAQLRLPSSVARRVPPVLRDAVAFAVVVACF
jgi:hypothetical protein